MAIDKTRLTKEWIGYLKDLQIAISSKTEPGKLDYIKKVTSDVVSHFLEVKADFTEEQISNAIHMVLARKAQSGGPAKLQNKPTPGTSVSPRDNSPQQQAPKQIGSNQPKVAPAAPRKRYSKDNATDVDYKDLNEEIKEVAYTLDEKDIEDIFSILTSAAPKVAPKKAAPAVNPEAAQAKKEEEIRTLRRTIRDKMSPGQRRALWRALTDA